MAFVACKRIIGGRTYNTDTSTALLKDDLSWSSGDAGEGLYMSRAGELFLYQFQKAGYLNDHQTITPLSSAEAEDYARSKGKLNARLLTILGGRDSAPQSSEVKYTLRLPAVLRDAAAESASKKGMSLNAWLVRCIEAKLKEK